MISRIIYMYYQKKNSSHVDHPGITRTGLCIDDTISPHTLPSLELGSRRTRSTSACRSLITAPTAATFAATLSAQSSPFSQHWCRYLRYAPLPEMTSRDLHTMKSLKAGGFIFPLPSWAWACRPSYSASSVWVT